MFLVKSYCRQRLVRVGLSKMRRNKSSSFAPNQEYWRAYKKSIENRDQFWREAAEGVDWFKPFSIVHDGSKSPFEKWFPDGTLNTCYNCIDRHVKNGLGESPAIFYDSPVTNSYDTISYASLLDKVSKLSGVLRELGVGKGDVVVIYMPMIPEAQQAMLACARLGAVHCVVFGGFASQEVAVRIKDSKPKVVLTASCGIEGNKVIPYKPLLDKAIELASSVHHVQKVVVFQREQAEAAMIEGRDIDWRDAVSQSEPVKECTPVQSTDPSYILYTSGTTGLPKGVVRDTGGHTVALNWSMRNIMGMDTRDVWWSASDIGWVVGHSFTTYAPLLRGCATVLYEGKPVGTPDSAQYWRIIEKYEVNGMFTAPTALRSIKQHDINGAEANRFDLLSLRAVFMAGERCDPDTVVWLEKITQRPVRDNWWQTETGWPICGNVVGLEGYIPVKYGSVFRPVPGYDLQVLDDEGTPVARGTLGNLAIKLPLPPGTLQTLLNNDERFLESYMTRFPGHYDTSDAGIIDEDGYVHIMSRTDDVINVAGHRLSSGGMEEVLMDHKDVAEAVVIGCTDSLRGQVPLGLVVLNSGCQSSMSDIQKEIIQMVRDRIGAVAYLKEVVEVKRFPKTRSGKILRATLRKIADSQPYVIPPTVDDPDRKSVV